MIWSDIWICLHSRYRFPSYVYQYQPTYSIEPLYNQNMLRKGRSCNTSQVHVNLYTLMSKMLYFCMFQEMLNPSIFWQQKTPEIE